MQSIVNQLGKGMESKLFHDVGPVDCFGRAILGHRFELAALRCLVPAGQFLLYLPQSFSQHPASKYPLLIFLHGSGESGFDINDVKKHGPPKFLDDRPDFPFIVVSPQAPYPPRGFDPEDLTILVNQLLQRLPIYKDRVYLTGFSMGGYATYMWASVHPEIFAAIAPAMRRRAS